MTDLAIVQPVDLASLPEYPIDADARLDSHGFLQWEFRRWLSSDMRWSADHEVKSIWFELVNLAHSETPVGTLPLDTKRLARMVQPPVERERFENLCKLPFGPLHGWVQCLCGDEVRLMHPVVTRIVLGAFASRANHAARVEAASNARKLARLTEEIGSLAPKVASDPRKVRWICDDLDQRIQQRGGTRRTAQELHISIQACLVEQAKGRFPQVA